MQPPMISSPLKQTNELDWVAPIKAYIRGTYGDDPEKYNEECQTLNRLRQDMRGATKDSASGRDLLYRYYGQLELLDLRFPVDESHVKVLFTWFDAFTQKPTSQHSLAFEKASLIFNIAAVLSCYAAAQNRSESAGLKTAYHSFQASAGMFTYINENFLHAPSTDLNHQTVKTLIAIMLAQSQEVFLERQIADEKKPSLLAKLASQAAHLHSQAVEGVQENVNGAVFENVWLQITQIKASHLASVAQYYQALVDYEAALYGPAISRLQVAEAASKDAHKAASRMSDTHPLNANIGSEASQSFVDLTSKHRSMVQEKLAEYNKDNDFIYHATIPSAASLAPVAKTPAAKAISVRELYQGQDIQRIIGRDIFQRIVPMSVTESASLYDEEKAKLVRAEAERVETADGEMAASLDYLKLPGSLNILKGSTDSNAAIDEEFRRWCEDMTGHTPLAQFFEELSADKSRILKLLDQSSKDLDMEESVCEKMRSKYGAAWVQQPSSRLTTTLRSDIKNYRSAVDEASVSDTQLQGTLRQHEGDFEEMRRAAESGEVEALYQRALAKANAGRSTMSPTSPNGLEGNLLDDDFADGSASVAQQIAQVEEHLRKLQLVKRERAKTLKDLKDKVHGDDISQVLILNKRAITSEDHALFKSELEKFKPFQTRILQANHKQAALMKDLTSAYGELLQDKRVRAEQSKYESVSRTRGAVQSKYRRAAQAFADLNAGLERARVFYGEMGGTAENLSQNVASFIANRKSEGGELLASIESGKPASPASNRDHDKLKDLMERMSLPAASQPTPAPPPRPPTTTTTSPPAHRPTPLSHIPRYDSFSPAAAAATTTSPPPSSQHYQPPGPLRSPGFPGPAPAQPTPQRAYNPTLYGPVSPPPAQTAFALHQQHHQQQQHGQHSPAPQAQAQSTVPPGYVPPPPPPRPGGGPAGAGSGAGLQHAHARAGSQAGAQDPWAGLSGWR